MLLLGFFYLTRYLNVYIPINFYLFTVTQQPLWGQRWLAGGGNQLLGWVGRAGRARGAGDTWGGSPQRLRLGRGPQPCARRPPAVVSGYKADLERPPREGDAVTTLPESFRSAHPRGEEMGRTLLPAARKGLISGPQRGTARAAPRGAGQAAEAEVGAEREWRRCWAGPDRAAPSERRGAEGR